MRISQIKSTEMCAMVDDGKSSLLMSESLKGLLDLQKYDANQIANCDVFLQINDSKSIEFKLKKLLVARDRIEYVLEFVNLADYDVVLGFTIDYSWNKISLQFAKFKKSIAIVKENFVQLEVVPDSVKLSHSCDIYGGPRGI